MPSLKVRSDVGGAFRSISTGLLETGDRADETRGCYEVFHEGKNSRRRSGDIAKMVENGSTSGKHLMRQSVMIL